MTADEISLHASQHALDAVERRAKSVRKGQFVRALRGAGKWSAARTEIARMSVSAKEDWEFASRVRRNDTVTLALITALALSTEEVDALFASAAVL